MTCDKESCYNCHHLSVYARHENNKWQIYCQNCGESTEWYLTHSQARNEWDKHISGKEKKE